MGKHTHEQTWRSFSPSSWKNCKAKSSIKFTQYFLVLYAMHQRVLIVFILTNHISHSPKYRLEVIIWVSISLCAIQFGTRVHMHPVFKNHISKNQNPKYILHTLLHILGVHKVVSRKTDIFCDLCKKRQKKTCRNKTYFSIKFCLFYTGHTKCRLLWNYFMNT